MRLESDWIFIRVVSLNGTYPAIPEWTQKSFNDIVRLKQINAQ